MDTHLKQKHRIKENETVVTQANIESLKTCYSLLYFQGGDKISIIPEDEKATVKPPFWAYGDHILEDLMFGKNYMNV